ncbi:diguanylate cyclase [Deinococcus maricopensis]|uniref:Diguanylate cyclase with GAF sensor n=1 Tax=Deinococcus maricopensis (strain DSM 21211 / LMG 22137 / NRRL B-23946 / LB-34) TaxID=709986 RepID=E8U3B4_DEIML|nr:diguanylate cyclase [Deinococcus maricopensis]ADV65785.1 diguanylate cyclase with GAF sensor [Deinococcus maricopensis DSM 21211]
MPAPQQLTIRAYLLRHQALLWTVLLTFGALELWSTARNNEATRLANQTQSELNQAREIIKTVVDLETGIRGYAVTGESRFLEPYNAARGNFKSQIDALRDTQRRINDVDMIPNIRTLDHIEQTVNTWFVEIANYEIQWRPTHPERVVARESSGRGKQLIDSVRADIALFEASELRELDGLQQQAAQARLLNQLVTLFGVLGALIASVTSSIFVARNLSVKFGRLAEAAEHLAATEHALPVGGFHLTEAARLAESFNTMAGKLEASHERLTRQNTALQARNAEVLATNELAEQLQTCFTLQEGFMVLRSTLPQLFPNVQGVVTIMNASRNLLEPQVRWPPEPDGETPTDPLMEPSECWAIRSGQAYDPDQRRVTPPCGQHDAPGGHLCIPLVAHGEALGMLRLGALPHDERARHDLRERALAIASQVALGLSNLRLRETLRNQSIRDPLTGLFNRRYLDETFEREVRRAERHRRSLSILMLDVDHFKRFNDTFGHEAGDAVLVALAQLMTRHFRREDIVCRYGGEEFAVLLTDASFQDGLNRAEALRAATAELRPTLQGRALGGISISVGVSGFPEHARDSAELLRLADSALYEAKQAGRNRVMAAGR